MRPHTEEGRGGRLTRCLADVSLLTQWIDAKLADERLFPADEGAPYPANFVKQVKPLFRRMFRVHAHLYHSHFRQFLDLGAETHLNTCFKRFVFFVLEFRLVDSRELAPLQQLVDNLIERENTQPRQGADATTSVAASVTPS